MRRDGADDALSGKLAQAVERKDAIDVAIGVAMVVVVVVNLKMRGGSLSRNRVDAQIVARQRVERRRDHIGAHPQKDGRFTIGKTRSGGQHRQSVSFLKTSGG